MNQGKPILDYLWKLGKPGCTTVSADEGRGVLHTKFALYNVCSLPEYYVRSSTFTEQILLSEYYMLGSILDFGNEQYTTDAKSLSHGVYILFGKTDN